MNDLKTAHNIDDLRTLARKRLPRMVFDYIDGGADDEVTLAANRNRFSDYSLAWKTLVDVANIDTSTTVMGSPCDAPVIVTPTAVQRLFNPRAGEPAVARASQAAGLIYCLSTLASTSIEEIAKHTSGPKWFQVYVWKDRALIEAMLERVRNAGYTGLILTVDVPVAGNRERDLVNEFTVPPRITPSILGQMLARPGYLFEMLSTPKISPANYTHLDPGKESITAYLDKQFSRSVTWEDAKWMKDVWGGPFAIKGIARADDARRCVDVGADAVWVSNHGGRQLDTAGATIDLLSDVVDAVGSQAEVILDGGVRRGTDIIKALALGARAVAVGRPYLYGLAAGGEAGVSQALDFLATSLKRDLALTGVSRLDELHPDLVRKPTR
jgi:L-lactate dehydrogenase (cytochrome)